MSRQTILSKIAANKPTSLELPEIPNFPRSKNTESAFIRNAQKSGSFTFTQNQLEDQLLPFLRDLSPGNQSIFSSDERWLVSNVNMKEFNHPKELDGIDIALFKGRLAVAENAAIWITEEDFAPFRVLPFITQHLILTVPKNGIVANMHEAYQQIEIDEHGYGVFIAGPSKTADIEQSLVIGAQASRSLTIILLD